MGTNYYLTKKCSSCNHEERLHIGKSSSGWCFSLHVYPFGGDKYSEFKKINGNVITIESLEDWKTWFGKSDWKILNEYGTEISSEEMIEIVTKRSRTERKELSDYYYSSWSDFYEKNQAEPGPNNLLRSRIDNSHCIGHGEGTWDLIIGEFC